MKKILSLIAIILLALPATSQNMIVELSGDQENCVVALDKLQQITFDGTVVNIFQTEGDAFAAQMADINRIYFGTEETALAGDVNGDGTIDVSDVTMLVSMILGNTTTTTEGDANGDGTVDVSDVTTVVSKILGTNTRAGAEHTLYINNSNATYQVLNTADIEQITFDETWKTISIEGADGVKSRFATTAIDNISPIANSGAPLAYTLDKSVAFDAADATSFNEVTETIVRDELDDEYGDFIENFSTTKIIIIMFNESKVTCNSTLADVTYTITDNTHIVINSTRKNVGYLVRGTCSNGSVKIYSTYKFQLTLNNLTLTNPTGPAINIQSSKSVYFTVSNNTTNTLRDGATYATAPNNAAGEPEDQKGTIFSEGQLIFNGNGTLNVTSLGGHGICSDDYIRIRSGNINVTALKDGFNTNDMFRVGRTSGASPTITVKADGNGIDCGKGEVIIEAGKMSLDTGNEAIKVEYTGTNTAVTPNATIKGGYLWARTSNEKSAIIKTDGTFTQSGGNIQGETKGNGSKIVNSKGCITIDGGKLTGISYGTLSSDTTTAGGFKSDGDIIINKGTIAIDSRGEGSKGFNCNGKLVVNGGDITLLAEADNFVADTYDRKTRAITAYDFTINGGSIFTKAFDYAINATDINLNGGNITAVSNSNSAVAGNVKQTGGWLVTKDAE